MDKINEFIEMSKYIGIREDIVQAGGGNSSVKIDKDKMLIKSSGFYLSDIDYCKGYSTVNHSIITNFFENTLLDKITSLDEKELLSRCLLEGNKPSIETFLHAITDNFTIHIHPTIVNILTCRKNGMNILKQLFPDALFVNYATPGINLAKEYFSVFIHYKEDNRKLPNIIFLKNHGLVVSGKTSLEVIKQVEIVLNRIEKYLLVDMSKYQYVQKLYNVFKNIYDNKFDDIIYLSNNIDIKNSLNLLGQGKNSICFCPDSIVYCGKSILWLDKNFELDDIRKYIIKFGKPIIIIFNDNVYICASNIKKARDIESVFNFSLQVVAKNVNYDIDLLSEQEQNFLLNWDSEKYRKNLNY